MNIEQIIKFQQKQIKNTYKAEKKQVVKFWQPKYVPNHELEKLVNDFWIGYGENYDNKISNWTGD